jgi:O-antigen/teichoic acid export membrane protein
MMSGILNEVYNQVKPLIVGVKYSAVDLAYYNKGKSYPQQIASISTDTVSASLFPIMSKVQDDKNAVLGITRRFMQLSSFIVFPIMIGFLR